VKEARVSPAPERIHRLGSDDIALLRRMNELFAREFDDAPSYLGAPPAEGYCRDVLAQAHVIALVSIVDDEVVGALVAYQLPKLEQARSEVYLYDLAVARAHRRRGIATRLIERLQSIARERGAWVVFVQADHGDDPAVALYTKLGVREDVMHFDLHWR
jgi:aminoglycoside 3-N-acetyltransferase I